MKVIYAKSWIDQNHWGERCQDVSSDCQWTLRFPCSFHIAKAVLQDCEHTGCYQWYCIWIDMYFGYVNLDDLSNNWNRHIQLSQRSNCGLRWVVESTKVSLIRTRWLAFSSRRAFQVTLESILHRYGATDAFHVQFVAAEETWRHSSPRWVGVNTSPWCKGFCQLKFNSFLYLKQFVALER